MVDGQVPGRETNRFQVLADPGDKHGVL